jgi:peroxiredoxin
MHGLWLPLVLSSLAPQAAAPVAPTRVEEFTLRDFRGRSHRLSDWRDRRLVVVVFLGADCPLAKLYAPRLVELARAYEPRGVTFVAIDSNRHDTPGDLRRYARQHAIPFPVLKDVGNVVADRFRAERSPEAFVLDERRVVRYRGRIDDRYEVGVQRPRPTRRDLAAALDELLTGRPVSKPVTVASGCPLSRVRRAGAGAEVTYCRDVAPILQRRCQVCHRPGQVAPFALTSYRAAAGWAGAIREVVEDGRMPPWGANPAHGRFANDPSLTAAEKRVLFAWIDAGCPEGDPAQLPPPARFPEGWGIGEPDQVLAMAEPFTVPAEGVIEYQYFVADPGSREDRWVRAAEILPGNKAVVHHCNVFLQAPGHTHPDDLSEQGSLGSYCLTQMAPGTPPMVLPDGMAKRIPAGWRVVFVVHYTAVGSVQTDRTRLGLKFADPRAVKQEVATRLMYDLDLSIPPGAAGHEVSQTWEMRRDVLLLSLFPHMHLRGKSFRYTARYPDGAEEILLDVPRYDFNWQHRYNLAEPKRLPAGTRLRCSAVYDNSADNPANPDPGATVRAGTQSWDEMFNGYFDVVLAEQDLTREWAWPAALWRGAQAACRPPVAVLAVLFGGLFLTRRRFARWLGADEAK